LAFASSVIGNAANDMRCCGEADVEEADGVLAEELEAWGERRWR